jgi:hypothetical protein
MKLTGKILIDERKIREYLLIYKVKDDKSKFLDLLGYSDDNWLDLQADIENIVKNNDAEFSKKAPFGGSLYRVVGNLRDSEVVTVWLWLNLEDEVRFITLFPT